MNPIPNIPFETMLESIASAFDAPTFDHVEDLSPRNLDLSKIKDLASCSSALAEMLHYPLECNAPRFFLDLLALYRAESLPLYRKGRIILYYRMRDKYVVLASNRFSDLKVRFYNSLQEAFAGIFGDDPDNRNLTGWNQGYHFTVKWKYHPLLDHLVRVTPGVSQLEKELAKGNLIEVRLPIKQEMTIEPLGRSSSVTLLHLPNNTIIMAGSYRYSDEHYIHMVQSCDLPRVMAVILDNTNNVTITDLTGNRVPLTEHSSFHD